jgi:acylphosphatase
MDVRATIIVKGRVQGVGFRYYTITEAGKLGLYGTVTNLLNGDVKVIAEGNKSTVLTLIKSLRIGPRFSNVSNVVADFKEPTGEFSSFKII